MQERILLKIITAGDGGVGKTTLLNRFVDGSFNINTKMTIGVEIHQKIVMIGESRKCELLLWDLGGQEHFRFMLDRFVGGSSGAILMFDLTRLSTLYNLDEWVDIVRDKDPNLPIILVGGKLDLAMDDYKFDDIAMEYKQKYDCLHFLKVSSVTGENVDEIFDLLVKGILKYRGIEY